MWKEENNQLSKTFTFGNYIEAVELVNKLTVGIKKLQHHSVITLTWGKVVISTPTHDAGNIVTEKDYQLTELIDNIK